MFITMFSPVSPEDWEQMKPCSTLDHVFFLLADPKQLELGPGVKAEWWKVLIFIVVDTH